jgi:hypothetical protein
MGDTLVSPAAAGTTIVQQGPAVDAPIPSPLISLAAVRMDLRKLQSPGVYELMLRNTGAEAIDLRLDGRSEGGRLAISVHRDVSLSQGASETLNVYVSPRKKRLFGGRRLTTFTIAAAGAAGGSQPPITVDGEYEEQPSGWPMFAGAGVLGIAGVAAVFMFALGGGPKSPSEPRPTPPSLAVIPTQEPATPTPPTPTPVPTEVPVVQPPANRMDCNAIRGTAYLSPEEGDWFRANCTAPTNTAPTQPQQQQTQLQQANPQPQQQQPQPQQAQVQTPPTPRPTAPSVTINCQSSLASATAGPNQQTNSLLAVADELINCSAGIDGSFTSVDWAGGQKRGTGLNFSVSFPAQPTNVPYNIVVDVNWGGNPVHKTIAVTTQARPGSGSNCTFGNNTQVCIGGGR